MIFKLLYKITSKLRELCDFVINRYHSHASNVFNKRMKKNPIFKFNELHFSATLKCPCGYGLAYPKDCGANHYWDCAGVLLGCTEKDVKHIAQLPFMFYDIKGESDKRGSTKYLSIKKLKVLKILKKRIKQ